MYNTHLFRQEHIKILNGYDTLKHISKIDSHFKFILILLYWIYCEFFWLLKMWLFSLSPFPWYEHWILKSLFFELIENKINDF